MKTIPLYEFGGPSVDDPTAITITSTSSRSGITEPINLRNATDFTRLQFHPKVIQNENEPSNCVKGSLVYEKKRKRDPGFPYDKPEELVTKGTVKAGGALRLDLDTSETRKLYDSLTRLYRVAGDMEGMPYGSATYVPIDRSAKTLVDLLKKDPSAMRMIADEGVFELVKELLKLLTQGISLEKLSETLGSLEDGSLQSLSASLNIERLIRVHDEFKRNLENGTERYWQDFFERNAWVISQIFSRPCTIFKSQAYVGGKSIGNTGSCLPDFLYRNKLTSNLAIVEIKTPNTKLLGKPYRDKSYEISGQLSGSITQALSYKHELLTNFNSLFVNEGGGFEAFSPMCVVVIGKTTELDNRIKRATFENFRETLNGVAVLTYDELCQKIGDLLGLLENGKTSE